MTSQVEVKPVLKDDLGVEIRNIRIPDGELAYPVAVIPIVDTFKHIRPEIRVFKVPKEQVICEYFDGKSKLPKGDPHRNYRFIDFEQSISLVRGIIQAWDEMGRGPVSHIIGLLQNKNLADKPKIMIPNLTSSNSETFRSGGDDPPNQSSFDSSNNCSKGDGVLVLVKGIGGKKCPHCGYDGHLFIDKECQGCGKVKIEWREK